MHLVNWVVKVSKLCNLRCRYCYEWNDLAKRDRMTLEQWERLFTAIRSYHEALSERKGQRVRTHVIWHGGEPLLLPTEYIASVLQLQREMLGTEALASGEYVNALQTNLHRVTDEQIELLRRERIDLGVSMDVVAGVRLSVGGYDRRANGEYALLVNTDRTLYQRIDAYEPARALGNVFTQRIEEILASPAYQASLERDEEMARRYCGGCEYLGACSRLPLFESPRTLTGKRCQVAYPLYHFMESYVREQGYSVAQLAEILRLEGSPYLQPAEV